MFRGSYSRATCDLGSWGPADQQPAWNLSFIPLIFKLFRGMGWWYLWLKIRGSFFFIFSSNFCVGKAYFQKLNIYVSHREDDLLDYVKAFHFILTYFPVRKSMFSNIESFNICVTLRRLSTCSRQGFFTYLKDVVEEPAQFLVLQWRILKNDLRESHVHHCAKRKTEAQTIQSTFWRCWQISLGHFYSLDTNKNSVRDIQRFFHE